MSVWGGGGGGGGWGGAGELKPQIYSQSDFLIHYKICVDFNPLQIMTFLIKFLSNILDLLHVQISHVSYDIHVLVYKEEVINLSHTLPLIKNNHINLILNTF